ncbi:MAG: Coenzyme F420 hydrogenase/dehydrogenase, beta subunit C-terminal domain [Deltaproteobacteria bacterium]|nr:Coenzyme F420 hydrogenase/dehydrogenase, beta subunit C-terminal domain [Deltaproteobacteria bacterium]
MERIMKGQRALLEEVGQSPFCTGCGACVNLCAYHAVHEDHVITLHECDIEQGRCYAYCPRTPTDRDALRKLLFAAEDITPELGAVRGYYIARAADEAKRAGAQHGGTVTALMTLAMKEGIIESAIVADDGPDLLPRGVTINFPEEIARQGKSRFVVSPNVAEFNALAWAGGRKIGIVATPCQTLALAKMRARPVAAHAARIDQLKLVVGLFCGWALSWEKLRTLVLGKGIDPKHIEGMDILPSQYQMLQVYTKQGTVDIPLDEVDPACVREACHYCPDMTAEFADISVGSTRLPEGWDVARGWNQVIVRTPLGEELLALARTKGILEFRGVPEGNLDRLKKASLSKRKTASENLAVLAEKGAAGLFGKPDSPGQPVVSVYGGEAFFQEVLPSLANAVRDRANMTVVVSNAGGRNMMGFTPNPASGVNAVDDRDPHADMTARCEAVGAKVRIRDPFDLEETRAALSRMMKEDGVKVLVLRQSYALSPEKPEKKEYAVSISETLCLGEKCGCNRLCTRVFHCPALVWDQDRKKPRIEEDICTGCGVCSLVCTTGAIVRRQTASA